MTLAFLLAVLAGPPSTFPADAPQAAHEHAHGTEKLGTVDFPVSCLPAAREKFTRATALLHSFAYEDSE